MSNKKFRVQIKEQFGEPVLSITNNGFQWTSILLRDPIYEIPLIIDEIQRYLTSAMHSDGGSCSALEKSSIPGDEETFNNGHGW